MPHFEVIARLKIRPGELEGFKTQAAELMRLTREYDRKTLRYDWYIDEDAMECEVHEDYVDESGLIEHNEHIVDARGLLFETYASDHRMSVYGEISPQLAELFKHHAAGVAVHHFFQGLEGSIHRWPEAGTVERLLGCRYGLHTGEYLPAAEK